MKPTAALVLVLAFLAPRADADTLDVPSPNWPTIQSAILAAQSGDVVNVLPGIYFEHLDFGGKAISVRSAMGPEVTTIDGSGSGTVVRFALGETASSVLEGFTIIHGVGPNGVGAGLFGLGGHGAGGGIHCEGASPTIRDCIITDNLGGSGGPGSPAGEGAGGGIQCRAASPTVEQCVISCNQGGGGGFVFASFFAERAGGGGIDCAAGSDPIIHNTRIEDNLGGDVSNLGISAPGKNGGAGGVHSALGCAPVVLRCQIRGNRGGLGGGVAFTIAPGVSRLFSGGAGGVHCEGLVYIVGCSIEANVGGDGISTGGGFAAFGGAGGVHAAAAPGPFMASSVIARNTGGRGFSGGVPFYGSAGGVHCQHVPAAIFFCTLTENVGGAGTTLPGGAGGVDARFNPQAEAPVIKSSILWRNVGGGAGAPPEIVGVANVEASNVEGGVAGVGTLNADPLFFDVEAGDYHLSVGSPCRDSGVNTAPLLPLADIDGEPRLWGIAPDMGADEFVGLEVCAAGSAGADVLRVNGSVGGAGRLVRVAGGTPLTIAIAPPPASPGPAYFVLTVGIDVAMAANETLLPAGVGMLCTGLPGTVGVTVLTSSFGAPGLVESTPAPWSIIAPSGLPAGAAITLHGIIAVQPDLLRTMNAVAVMAE